MEKPAEAKPDSKPEKGAAAKATIEKMLAKPGEADVSQETKGEDDAGGETDFQKAHREKKEAAKKNAPDPVATENAALKKRIADLEAAAKAPEKKEAKAKFELPKIDLPDWDKIKEDEDIVPHVKKAFESTVTSLLKTIEQLVERLDARDADIDDLSGFAEKMSQARAKKWTSAINTAIEGAITKIKETYGVDEIPEAVGQAFVKFWQGGVIEHDPNEDLPDADLLLKAWKLDNQDILEKHTAKNGKTEEKKEEAVKKPLIRGASSGGGEGAPLKGRAAIEAIISKANPGLKKE